LLSSLRLSLAPDAAGRASGASSLAARAARHSPRSRAAERTIAIVPFANDTGDESLDWLRRGLTDMLVAELAQSPYLKVAAVRIEAVEELEVGRDGLDDAAIATLGRAENADTILTGRFHRDDKLLIDAELHEGGTGRVLKRETVSGEGLEQIFRMVTDLSGQLRVTLRGGELENGDAGVSIGKMTTSLEAFRQYSRGRDLAENMLISAADAAFTKAIELDSSFAAAHLRLFRCKLQVNDPKAAAAALGRAKEHQDRLSESERILLRIGEAQLSGSMDEFNRARKDLWERAPFDIDARIESAHLLYMRGDLDRALEEFEVITEMDPDRAPPYNQLGYIYAMRGDTTTALKKLERYRQLTPGQPNAYDSKGEILAWAGRFDEAREQFETALSKWPTFYNSSLQLSMIHSELGNLDLALRYSDKWIAAAPGPRAAAQAWAWRAAMFARFHRLELVEPALAEARALAPDLVHPVFIGSEIRRAFGDEAGAAKLERAFFEAHRDAVASWPTLDSSNFVWFLVHSRIPPAEAIPVIERVTAKETSSFIAQLNRLYVAVLQLRSHDPGPAAEFLAHPDANFLASLAVGKSFARSLAWRCVIEAVAGVPGGGDPDLAFVRAVAAAGEQTDRQDVVRFSEYLEAEVQAAHHHEPAFDQIYRSLGAPAESRFLVLGPFDNRSGFHRRFAPELSPDLAESTLEAGKELKWRPADDGVRDGYVDLREIFDRALWSVGYAAVDLRSPGARVVNLRLSTTGPFKLWLNGDLVSEAYRPSEGMIDGEIVKVALRPGDNRLLLKVTNAVEEWGFQLRATDEDGNGMPDLEWRTPRIARASSASKSPR
jgi:tetratricopeptide (TPR) repeat protein